MPKQTIQGVIPATALTAGTTTSKRVDATTASGVRLFVTVAGASTTGGIDSVSLCAVPPGSSTALPIVGFAGASFLSVNGTYIADFYPGAWLPASVAAGGKLLGSAGVYLPSTWAVQVVLATGSAATITIDAEMLP